MCKGAYDCLFHQLSMISFREGASSKCLYKAWHDDVLLVHCEFVQVDISAAAAMQERVPMFPMANSLGFGVEDCSYVSCSCCSINVIK